MSQRRKIVLHRGAIVFIGALIPLAVAGYLYFENLPQESAPPAIITATFAPSPTEPPFLGRLLTPTVFTASPEFAGPSPTASPPVPTLADFWNGTAEWRLEIEDTGLPVGESDTLNMGNGVFWSYLHASTETTNITDSCGDPVEFPGCVVRYISTDDGRHFDLADSQCIFECDTCPCDDNDRTWQQQYPRVVGAPNGGYIMVFEHGAATMFARSTNGVRWTRPAFIPYTGVWHSENYPCSEAMHINPHPFHPPIEYDCMAGGPPGLVIADGWIYVFLGLGQNPGHMGCYKTPVWNLYLFESCVSNPLFSGASEYGPFDAQGYDAAPYFDFRYITSADVVRVGDYFYMAYEGIRGPSAEWAGRDNQFALGFARSTRPDGAWEEYAGNPWQRTVLDNWGIGHADIVIVDGITTMYTATPQLMRGRYVLVFK